MTATTDTTYDEAAEYWAEYDGADWYCNHDVPNGCRECAWLRQEDAMLESMTPAERESYFARYDNVDGEPF